MQHMQMRGARRLIERARRARFHCILQMCRNFHRELPTHTAPPGPPATAAKPEVTKFLGHLFGAHPVRGSSPGSGGSPARSIRRVKKLVGGKWQTETVACVGGLEKRGLTNLDTRHAFATTSRGRVELYEFGVRILLHFHDCRHVPTPIAVVRRRKNGDELLAMRPIVTERDRAGGHMRGV